MAIHTDQCLTSVDTCMFVIMGNETLNIILDIFVHVDINFAIIIVPPNQFHNNYNYNIYTVLQNDNLKQRYND